MIHTVLFDLGNVLVPLDFDRAYRAASRRTGLSEREVAHLLHDSGLSGPYERGEMTSREFHRRMDSLLGLGYAYEPFRHLWCDMFRPEALVDEALLDELDPQVRIAILSNTNELHWEWIRERYPVVRRFEKAVLSYEVGALKPDPAIYAATLEAVGARPEECFFTDDKPENVEGARAVGIQAETFVGVEPLREQLAALGLLRK
ncbi:MAG: HAD-IA family hydrolase [Acidobacteria bacterium]|nr:HAD-IA family hydrolase [Acidobacteriota bacterium]